MINKRGSIKIRHPRFRCPKDLAPHLESVFLGEYEVPLWYAGKLPVILDLGANFGAFSVWASHRWPGAEIHAYEPNPETYEMLQTNLEMYPLVRTYNHGIGTPGLRILSDGANNSGECSFYQVANNPAPTGRHCEVRSPLTLPEANILKMDIEGCEGEVLGPLLLAGRKFDAIMFEYHNRDLRRELEAWLKGYVLVGSRVYSPDLGVLNFVHGSLT